MKIRVTLLNLLLLCVIVLAEQRIVVTGELHGALGFSSWEGAGGIGGIKSIWGSVVTGRDLIVDAGGFSAGGIYDIHTAGRVGDSLRTEKMWETLTSMNYSAITLGDDDLAWGAEAIRSWQKRYPLPLVSCNVIVENVDIPTYLRLDSTVVTGVVTERPVQSAGEGVSVKNIYDAVGSVVKELKSKERLVVLTHCDPDEIDSLAKRFPEISVIVRGHRLGRSGETLELSNKTFVVPFSYEGKSLILYELADLETIPVQSVNYEFEYPVQEQFDLYSMSGCPYSRKAIAELLKMNGNNKISFSVHFAGSIVDDSLVPGLPDGDVYDEMTYLAVQKLYPSLFNDFLWLVSEHEYSVENAVEEMELDQERLNNWVDQYGKRELAVHYRRSERLSVVESPTLFINNRQYNGDISKERFQFELCRTGADTGVQCESYGECLDDSDCNKRGYAGKCEGKVQKRCRFEREPEFTIVQILPADTTFYDENNEFTSTSKQMFPSVMIKTLRQGSLEADSLIKRWNVEKLPFFLMDTTIAQTSAFASVDSGLVRENGKYHFKEGVLEGNFYLNREVKAGEGKLFVDVSTSLYEEIRTQYSDVVIYPKFDKTTELDSELKEVVRQLGYRSKERYYKELLEGISSSTPVYILWNNNRVEEIDSPSLLEMRIDDL